MRGGIVFTIGVAMMAIALTAVVGAVIWVNRMEDTPVIAQEPVAAPTPTPAPAKPEPERAQSLGRATLDLPDAPEQVERESDPKPATSQKQPTVRPRPAADTTTLVSVRECRGGTLKLNLAEKQMLDLHNRTRKQRGLGTLCASRDLTQAARAHSQDMLARDYFEHDTPEGITPEDRTTHLGRHPADGRSYELGAENLAMGGDNGGTGSPDDLFVGLMNSPGHKVNIVNGEFTEVGVGAKRGAWKGHPDDTATVFTVNFGGWR